ncbi:MAG TPA: hypothetical protein VN598_16040 [Usitatibacter sp.]|nr:hypothetical protein [Usitatibacter sp.]
MGRIVTSAQRRLALTWAIACVALCLVFVFGPWLFEQGRWFQYALLALIPLAIKWDRSSPSKLSGSAASRVVGRYPLIKLWLAACAILSLGLALITARTGFLLWDLIGDRGLLIALVLLVASIIIVVERERFVALREAN